VLFSKDGPHASKTKKGDSRLDHEIQAVLDPHNKDMARATIGEVIEKEKHRFVGTENQKETV
jgi:hypothetical protein